MYDTENQLDNIKGAIAELEDCSFPLLEKAVATSDLSLAFKDSDFNFIISNVQKLSHMNRS